MQQIRAELQQTDKASGQGPFQTSLGVALTDYGRQRLPYLKGARQEAQRINQYLRAIGLPIFKVEEISEPVTDVRNKGLRHFNVTLVAEKERTIRNSLKQHRQQQDAQRAEADRVRKRLSATPVAEITMRQMQALMDAMVDAGVAPATIQLERALLRHFFNHARKQWQWTRPHQNPAGEGLTLPTVDNKRDQVLTQRDWERLHVHLKDYCNPYAYPLVMLLLESAMRIGEPLVHTSWGDVDWERNILRLGDAKAGQRNVPLSPHAVRILRGLQAQDEASKPADRIFKTTYEAIKKAWADSCKKAGISDIRLHDLRHTSATRYAIEFNGNQPYLKVITGHKTDVMLNRYINIKAEHVALAMHKKEIPPELAPAGYRGSLFDADAEEFPEVSPAARASNVIRVAFGRAAA
ncbi:Shufflon-specific DNA recombinase, putative [Ricinus communis]|uniref:Shufflon-specific DNA recombinase, putative n=1 Tax=Ricinus communis TaxID=3988 RepID=B9TFB1_RICCO|nr:Shufflon-specific DNA recombinase, putative [Ricinus communis]